MSVRPGHTAPPKSAKKADAPAWKKKETPRTTGDRSRNKQGSSLVRTSASGANEVHRRLKFHEKKLLRQHDFFQYEQDNWHEPFCIAKYNLTDREDYRRYWRLVGLIRGLMTQLRYLPPESKIRMEVTQQLTTKLYEMGLISDRTGLAEVDKCGVEAFCKRRLPSVLVALKMAPNCKFASDFIEHGHVRVAATQVRDPAFLVPRELDDYVTWTAGSAIRKQIESFGNTRDDAELA